MQRGHYKQNIFYSSEDYYTFLQLLNKYHDKYKIEIITYCLMPNHYHLLVKGKYISFFMQQLNKNYSQYFNKKYSKVGTLYQGKYNKRPIYDNDSLLKVFAYIINNPYKAKICAIEEYPWSGYSDIKHKNISKWQIQANKPENQFLKYSNPEIVKNIENNLIEYIKKAQN